VLTGELYGSTLRLAANLLFTRLLYPEAFGLMLIVNLVLTALNMLSDVGVRGLLIARNEEPDRRFVNTAWTLTIVRGWTLAAICIALAYPTAIAYESSALFGLVLVTSAVPAIRGFTSPYPLIAEKQIRLARVVVWRCLAQTVGTIITLIWLLVSPSVWALAGHGIFIATVSAATSFWLFDAPAPRIQWDRAILAEFYRFGRWVLLGTGLTFLGRQGDSVIVSRFLDLDQLGLFSIAVTLAKLVETIAEKLAWQLLFPVFAELRGTDAGRRRRHTRRIRIAVYSLCFPAVFGLSVFGGELIEVLYDDRYADAGWMLEVMAVGMAFFALGATVDSVPMAYGDSFRHMLLQGLRVLSVIVSMTAGGMLYGVPGLIFGIAIARVVYYALLQLGVRRFGVVDLAVDLVFVAALLVFCAIGWSLTGWPQPVV
jgi:O-antigen/teichoic acid export membrane protein